MRNYVIYLMEEDVAQQYIGRETKIFQLFLEHKKATTHTEERILSKQINYITRPIPASSLQQLFTQTFNERADYQQLNFSHYIKQDHPKSYAHLKLSRNKIELISEGNYDSETMFFEVMRQHSTCFFAFDLDSFRFGWLSPMKEKRYI